MSGGLLLCNAVPFAFKSGVSYLVSRLEREGGWLLECKHPTKEGMDFVRDALFPLIERLWGWGGGGVVGGRWKIGGINGEGKKFKLH